MVTVQVCLQKFVRNASAVQLLESIIHVINQRRTRRPLAETEMDIKSRNRRRKGNDLMDGGSSGKIGFGKIFTGDEVIDTPAVQFLEVF